jgi:thioredoxin 1
MEHIMQSTNDAEFKKDVLESALPVLVDFWAPWCAPCRALAPVLEELDAELSGKVKIVKVNVDENGIVAGQLGIRSIPTVVVFKDGQAVEGAVGALSKGELIALLDKHVAVATQG